MKYIDALVDEKNRDLYDFVSSCMNVRFERTVDDIYVVYRQGKSVVFYIPDNNLSPASFTHELLHAKLHALRINIGVSIRSQASEMRSMDKYIDSALFTHMGNTLEHEKFFSTFVAIGYDESEFISDYDSAPMTDDLIETYKSRLKSRWLWNYKYDLSILNSFIGQYFSLKSWHNSNFDNAYYVSRMAEIEPKLCAIIDDLFKRWMMLDIYNDKLFDESSGKFFDTYGDIASSFVGNLEGWLKSKRF